MEQSDRDQRFSAACSVSSMVVLWRESMVRAVSRDSRET